MKTIRTAVIIVAFMALVFYSYTSQESQPIHSIDIKIQETEKLTTTTTPRVIGKTLAKQRPNLKEAKIPEGVRVNVIQANPKKVIEEQLKEKGVVFVDTRRMKHIGMKHEIFESLTDQEIKYLNGYPDYALHIGEWRTNDYVYENFDVENIRKLKFKKYRLSKVVLDSADYTHLGDIISERKKEDLQKIANGEMTISNRFSNVTVEKPYGSKNTETEKELMELPRKERAIIIDHFSRPR